jgi:hypothetical protein
MIYLSFDVSRYVCHFPLTFLLIYYSNGSQTPLHLASEEGMREAARNLLCHGAIVDDKNVCHISY